MLEKTNGVVLHSIKYNDSSTIVTIYTSEFGRSSYMVRSVSNKKSKFRAAFLQPLSLVDLDVSQTPGKDVHTIKDVRILYPLTGIPSQPVKNALALFMSELLYRCLKQTGPDETLFMFLENSVKALDCCEDGLANFHLAFMMKLSRFLGFSPNNEMGDTGYFDLINGIFTNEKPQHNHFIMPEISRILKQALELDYLNLNKLVLNREQRFKLLEVMIEFYRLHVPEFYGLKSLQVLHDIFN
ncbi:MAG: DNA repair protein RecO [Paludibacter sp.]|nr:DNA repair protein RecO [Paludibacter sp.]